MSEKSVLEFVKAVENDDDLAKRCSAAGNLAEVVGFAAERGFDFSEEHIRSFAAKLNLADDQLSDEELESVAGGFGLLDQHAVTINNNHRQVMSTFPEVGSITSVLRPGP